jgi:hypothetical protein
MRIYKNDSKPNLDNTKLDSYRATHKKSGDT